MDLWVGMVVCWLGVVQGHRNDLDHLKADILQYVLENEEDADDAQTAAQILEYILGTAENVGIDDWETAKEILADENHDDETSEFPQLSTETTTDLRTESATETADQTVTEQDATVTDSEIVVEIGPEDVTEIQEALTEIAEAVTEIEEIADIIDTADDVCVTTDTNNSTVLVSAPYIMYSTDVRPAQPSPSRTFLMGRSTWSAISRQLTRTCLVTKAVYQKYT